MKTVSKSEELEEEYYDMGEVEYKTDQETKWFALFLFIMFPWLLLFRLHARMKFRKSLER